MSATAERAAAGQLELLATFWLAGIEAAPTDQLDVPDREASLRLPELAETLAANFRARRPEVIITHACEGGHPDHDATAFAVLVTLRITSRPWA